MKIIRPSAVLESGGSFTRASTATYYDRLGVLKVAPIDSPRYTYTPDTHEYRGLQVEPAATNLILNSDTVVTQSITVSAVSYTIMFKGTGSVTLSGSATAILTGTGTNSIISYTFIPTIGSLTITIVGSVTNGQLELGTKSTSYIPTTSVPVSRSPDVLTGTGLVYSNLPEAGDTLLTKPETLATQTVVVTAQAYTISFTGTGTIAMIGVHTYSLVGTGSSNRVSYTFTPTAGNLVLTVTGSVTLAQLEVGSILTPYRNEPLWVGATTYTTGQEVSRPNHKIYRSIAGGLDAVVPELAPAKWLEISPTNKWAIFDSQIGTATTASRSITYIIRPGRLNSLALMEVDASYVSITLVLANGEIVYKAEADLDSGNSVGDWYQYFYEPIYQQDSLVITDLVDTALMNIPAYGEAYLHVTLSKASGDVSCGIMVLGLSADLGFTQNAPTIGIIDYSRKDVDIFGNPTIIKRKYSKRVSTKVQVYSKSVDSIARILAQYRSTPLVWVGADNTYTSLIVYGFYRDFEITIDNIIMSSCTLQIEGLT